jgi:hypothetical protein
MTIALPSITIRWRHLATTKITGNLRHQDTEFNSYCRSSALVSSIRVAFNQTDTMKSQHNMYTYDPSNQSSRPLTSPDIFSRWEPTMSGCESLATKSIIEVIISFIHKQRLTYRASYTTFGPVRSICIRRTELINTIAIFTKITIASNTAT